LKIISNSLEKQTKNSEIYNVGIVGGGISGVVTALSLDKEGIDSVLFEKKTSVVNGPPFCHLHAGGNLYPDISDEQCRKLMRQSIEMARLFPLSIDKRPTFISIPKSEKYDVNTIERRLKMLVVFYKKLINEDPGNEILGAPDAYYKKYNKEDLLALVERPTVKYPKSADEWMTNTIKLIDYKYLKTPVFIVQEYGWNLFRVGAQAKLALDKSEKCSLRTNTEITHIEDVRDQNLDYNWKIITNDTEYKVKYLVNSCGFKTGKLDHSLNFNVKGLIEFKAAYISKWKTIPGLIPELIFHGERATSHGMAQLTPYNGDFYQIHGMTKDITLFEKGLIESTGYDRPHEFDAAIKRKLNSHWEEDEINSRTENAIKFISHFVHSFQSATVGGIPLYGAQQIPGEDPNLRVGEASFPSPFYARSQIVKAPSALTVANQIINKIKEEEELTSKANIAAGNTLLDSISKQDIDKMASKLAVERGYPEAMSHLLIDRD